MKKWKQTGLDFIVDKLTNSIENANSGDRFPTEISLLTKDEIKALVKKKGWRFNWSG